MGIKIREFKEHNYKGIHVNGKTIRIALDPTKPIDELVYPEFYDVKMEEFCDGRCPYCYVDSKHTDPHMKNIIEKFESFYGGMSDNEKPFQIAFGGGEPTEHPQFIELMKLSHSMGIMPNYTTNGMWIRKSEEEQQAIIDVLGSHLDCWVLRETCLDCVKYKGSKITGGKITFGVKSRTDALKIIEDLEDLEWEQDINNNYIAIKDDISIEFIKDEKRDVKPSSLLNIQVFIPINVSFYLDNEFGIDWGEDK